MKFVCQLIRIVQSAVKFINLDLNWIYLIYQYKIGVYRYKYQQQESNFFSS